MRDVYEEDDGWTQEVEFNFNGDVGYGNNTGVQL